MGDASAWKYTLVESTLLVCTHNMVVESGFSKMKTTETVHMSHMTLETYNSFRTIQDYWNVDELNNFEVSAELDALVIAARKRYLVDESKKVNENTRKRSYADEMREEVLVFKRRSTIAVLKELSSTAEELAKARKLVEDLETRQNQLRAERDAPSTSFL